MSSRMRHGISTADIAIEVLREFDCSLVWYGHPNLLHEIADRAGFRRGHPLNRTAAVVRVVGQSDRFEFAGVIRHLGREYRCYREKGSSAPAGDIR